MTAAQDLMEPIAAMIYHTQSLKDAAQRLTPGGVLVVLDLEYCPIGLLTDEDLSTSIKQDPQGWADRRCASLVHRIEACVGMDHPIEGVLKRYRQGETAPMLVINGVTVVGVLYPSAVFEWRTEHQPAALNTTSESLARN